MARQKSGRDDEQIEVLSDQDPVEVNLDPVDDAARSVIVADATKKSLPAAPPPESIPPVKRYVVVKGGSVLVNGMRTQIKEGKVVDSLNYDVAHLQRQGIRVQREETANYGIIE
jgi:hypothetical protein